MPRFNGIPVDEKKPRFNGVAVDQPSTVEDVVKSGASGLARGTADILAMPANMGDAINSGMTWLYDTATGSNTADTKQQYYADRNKSINDAIGFAIFPEDGGSFLGSGNLRRGLSYLTGGATDYQPQTTVGEYARTISEFAPSAVFAPGNIPAKIAQTAIPAVMSETAGQITEGSALEPYARIVGALGGSLLTSAAMSRPVQGALGIGNEKRAQGAIREALERSGRSADDVVNDLAQAAAEGQGAYTVADSLGNSGQRMLSGVVRQPGNSRQSIVEALEGRQAGQGRRISGFLEDAFGSPQTASQTEDAIIALRRTQGNANYGAARKAAGAVDVTPAIQAIDDVVQPGVTPLIGAGADDTGVFATLNKARGYLTDGKSQISDFDRALLAKQEMDALIEKGGVIANRLKPARDALDDQLAKASAPYAAARDTYRQQSQALEAVDVGRNAARRGRIEDTIPSFQGMRPDQQAGFRAGYVDPLIESTQGAAVGVNKARPLINDAHAAEFPVFAQPGRADTLGRQLAREQRMFETRGAAIGGSRTADNIADMAEIGTIDPSVVGNILTGNTPGLIRQAFEKGANFFAGKNQATRDMIAQMLMENSPTRANAALAEAVRNGQNISRDRLAAIARMLQQSSTAAQTGRN